MLQTVKAARTRLGYIAYFGMGGPKEGETILFPLYTNRQGGRLMIRGAYGRYKIPRVHPDYNEDA